MCIRDRVVPAAALRAWGIARSRRQFQTRDRVCLSNIYGEQTPSRQTYEGLELCPRLRKKLKNAPKSSDRLLLALSPRPAWPRKRALSPARRTRPVAHG